MTIKYIRTELSKDRVKQKIGNSVYEIHKNDRLVGYLNYDKSYGWQLDIETKSGQKIRRTFYFKDAKQYVKELLA